ncbi:MAG: acyl-CoA dehydrogenase family protein [Phycisphaerae bacterium]
MGNFYKDNVDIQFLFEHLKVAETAEIVEEGFRYAEEYDYAPENAPDAVDNYRRILESVGEICAEVIAPTAEETDQVGNTLEPDGSVTRAPGIEEALNRLGQADLMGFTLPYRYGGINCPNLVYTMSNDILSRADAALMNIYGLQGIAETINAFASEEIKQEYLPPMASGEWTGAMVLTEPDAGSDLQAVKTRAYQDADGNWFVHGVKRFITNGCGEVLLVLARTEPEIADGRGLSLLLCERGPRVKIRRLENKLGIHGSPTCEIFFDDTPAKLIGERQRGLITYVMSLMNGARIGIASQSLGIGEAAYRVAREYGHSRKQFEVSIDNFASVRELLVKSRMDLLAARSLTYFASYCVDLEMGPAKKLEFGNITDKDERKTLKQTARKFGRWNKLLTPMAKYYASEMSMRVSNDAIAVLGGSGYMKDYPVERHLRDSRITTIYEGTSQLQVVAAIAGVTAGTYKTIIEDVLESPSNANTWPSSLTGPIEQIRAALAETDEAVAFVKSQSGNATRDLYARKLVDNAIYLLVGALLADHAATDESRTNLLKYWLHWRLPEVEMNNKQIQSGDLLAVEEFEALAGPVPVIE